LNTNPLNFGIYLAAGIQGTPSSLPV